MRYSLWRAELMKIDQVAYYCRTKVEEDILKQSLGLGKAEWLNDSVTAYSVMNEVAGINKAELSFNYSLGIELEILRYVEGRNWHENNDMDFFISHIGIHLDDNEEFPIMEDAKLVQETFTLTHTSAYLTTGKGAGRKYHYKIYELSSGNFLKFIKRILPGG